MNSVSDTLSTQLRSAGLRATPARRSLLAFLSEQAEPVHVQRILRHVPKSIDQATVYRILNRLVTAGLVREVHLQAGVVHYEAADRPHHHHVVCEKCGYVEDVTECRVPHRVASRGFSEVTEHSLEFIGICHACA